MTTAARRRRIELADRRLDLLIRQANDPTGGRECNGPLAVIEIELEMLEAVAAASQK